MLMKLCLFQMYVSKHDDFDETKSLWQLSTDIEWNFTDKGLWKGFVYIGEH